MLLTSLIAIIILLLCIGLLSAPVLFKKGRKFPNTHIEGNKALGEQGISCARAQDYEQRRRKTLEDRIKDNN